MQLRAELVHAETGVRVVQLSAWQDGECLGSTLAEAASVELAEQQAEARLRLRLSEGGGLAPRTAVGGAAALPEAPAPDPGNDVQRQPPQRIKRVEEELTLEQPTRVAATATAGTDAQAPITPARQEPPPQEPSPLDPEDWSDELAQIDLQLRRLGWDREQEGIYLERAFGHPSRSRLTTYADLVAYGQALTLCADGTDPASVPVPLRRRDLLHQCDQLLAQLQWDPARGRSFLEQHFQLSSRRQLNDEQLLQFNMLLETEAIMNNSPENQQPMLRT